MKVLLIIGTFLVLAKAQYPNSLYGAPFQAGGPVGGYPGSGQAGGPVGGYPGSGQGSGQELRQGQGQGGPDPQEEEEEPIKTVRHVFVHVAPDDEASGIARVIKAPIKRERQVSILFVKAPAPAAPDQQIVDIPNDGGRKTLVYVLLKKTDATPDVDFKTPPPTAPSKPEIYFIRYKDPKDQQKKGAGGAGAEYGAPAGSPPAPAQPQYGPPPAAQAPAKPQYSAPPPPPPGPQYGAPAPVAPEGYQK